MPSKTKNELASLLKVTRRDYRSAVVAAREELRTLTQQDAEEAGSQLGDPFSSNYLDPALLAKLTPHQDHGGADTERLGAAQAVLSSLLDQGDALFVVDVPKGGDLLQLVHARYAEIGRAFAAARSASLAQAGLPASNDEVTNMQAWPFVRWSLAERALAPGLLIKIHGEDLAADGLAAFADGSVQMAFEVNGPCSAAPLVGLIRPGTYVAQAKEAPTELPTDAPAFIALLGEASALFTHQPASTGASGESIFQRLEIESLPEASPTANLGVKSTRQIREELRQLVALAIEPCVEAPVTTSVASEATTVAPAAAADPADPIDRLAAWLLTRRQ